MIQQHHCFRKLICSLFQKPEIIKNEDSLWPIEFSQRFDCDLKSYLSATRNFDWSATLHLFDSHTKLTITECRIPTSFLILCRTIHIQHENKLTIRSP